MSPPRGDDFSRPLVPLEPSTAMPAGSTVAPIAPDPLVPPVEGPPPLLFGGDRAIVPAAKEAAVKKQSLAPESIGTGPQASEKPRLEAKPAARSLEATVDERASGDAALVIQAGWKELSRPSLQIALVVDPKADLAKLEPITLDGVQAESLWEQQVAAINKPLFPNAREVLKTSTAFLEYKGAQWVRVRARTNSLGRPAAYAVEDKLGTGLVFYLLDRWADDDGTLRIRLSDIDLAGKFAEPGRLKIWLLSEEKVIGSTTTPWPGKTSAAAAGHTVEKPGMAAKPGVAPTAPKSADSGPKPALPSTEAKAGSSSPLAKSSAPAKAEAAKPAAKPAETPKTPSATASAGAPPKTAVPPATTLGATSKDVNAMSIDELAAYIERAYGDQMNRSVRKSWLGGMRNYYQVENPEAVRRDVFMALLRSCWKEQRPGEMRDAFAVLYLKLKSQQPAGQQGK